MLKVSLTKQFAIIRSHSGIVSITAASHAAMKAARSRPNNRHKCTVKRFNFNPIGRESADILVSCSLMNRKCQCSDRAALQIAWQIDRSANGF